MSKLNVLGIDSDYDTITGSASHYRREFVYPYISNKCSNLETYIGRMARRHFVAPAACIDGLKYITASGHGHQNLFMGDQGFPIFEMGQYNSEEICEKIVHLLACHTAVNLGSDMVRQGCRAFFGYDELFVYVQDNPSVFWECDAEIDFGFCDGLNAEQVYQRVQNIYEKNINQFEFELIDAFKNDDVYNITLFKKIISVLQRNLNHLCAPSIDSRWGDVQASLSQI